MVHQSKSYNISVGLHKLFPYIFKSGSSEDLVGVEIELLKLLASKLDKNLELKLFDGNEWIRNKSEK